MNPVAERYAAWRAENVVIPPDFYDDAHITARPPKRERQHKPRRHGGWHQNEFTKRKATA